MDLFPNEDAEACFAILQSPEVIIDESSNLSEEIVLEDCTVEIQSTDVEYCPPYVEQTIELDSEEIIELDSEEIIELDSEEIVELDSEETIDHYEEIQVENEEIIIKDEVHDDSEIISEDLLIPTAECEIEIEQDYEMNCGYIKEETEDIIEMHDDEIEDQNSSSNDHYYCHICENSFPSENVLRSHMLQHTHRASTLFKCAVCKLMFQDTTSLATHMIKDHPENESFYTCNLCDKTFKRKFNLDFHYLEHCKGKSTLYKCNICGELFSSNNTLKNHILVSHSTSGVAATTSGERVQCGICNKSFQKSYLRIHMSTHMSNTEYTCHFCNKHLSSKQSLYMHMNTVHANEGCYECSYCEKRFFWKSYLDRHITVHTKEKSHHCTLCSKAFTRKLALRKHMATHTGGKDKYVNFTS